jgi:hypothetical protein
VAPEGVNADSTAAAAGLAAAEARPIAPVATDKPSVLNTLLLAAVIFMAVISCCVQEMGSGGFRDQ